MRRIIVLFLFAMLSGVSASASPLEFTDAQGHQIVIGKTPKQVVSVVPSITEIIFEIGAGDTVSGLTYHDIYPPEASAKPIVGGFFSPSLEKIMQLNPEIIFVSDVHKELVQAFKGQKCQLIDLNSGSLFELYQNIALLGKIFDREKAAEQVAGSIRGSLEAMTQKLARIPESQRKRVIRLMGRDKMMTPGDDSFQNEYIRLAGGIPPKLNKTGSIVEVTKEEWMNFDPQVVYGCGGDRQIEEKFFSQPGWKDVDAVKNRNILYFPCDLTCRASTRAGYFVTCLGARIYGEEFAKKDADVFKDHVTKSDPVSLPLEYVREAKIIHSYVHDFVHKSLQIEFKDSMAVSSTLDGYREGIRFVGNSYSPPQVWGLYHRIGLERSRSDLFSVLKRTKHNTSFLFTGADMENLSVKKHTFKEMTVFALVTAGVKSNAVRMSQDTGHYYEPGTINMILLTNMRLSPRAMNRAIISATEAKTAALWDMDIRSTYSPLTNPATGTGTDNIIVVQGTGTPIENAGGHSKMGELIARVVYDAVHEAVYKQNGLVRDRDIFERLKERKISMLGLIAECDCENAEKQAKSAEMEKLLLDPKYAAFLESAFALSDHHERGLIKDVTFFRQWCDQVAEDIAGREIGTMENLISDEHIPEILKAALNAMMNGVLAGKNDKDFT